ncbi:hypothetical protein [Alicyclobacillus vulcanalis]|uniref:Uncharacterized protein n=1 Tax=Alicyclobacillus vulcanalis TaxID=252246 RepID=A0A1N7PL91_9BACL|nr:hypothetical protein [Alicyclobacillus vulcanalis]SIT11362.1 hypothetical protein SAMN05421799_11465 [Alicyclobacillus vulcanalis]
MGTDRLFELLGKLALAVLNVAKAYIEYRKAKLRFLSKTNENGAARQDKPRT